LYLQAGNGLVPEPDKAASQLWYILREVLTSSFICFKTAPARDRQAAVSPTCNRHIELKLDVKIQQGNDLREQVCHDMKSKLTAHGTKIGEMLENECQPSMVMVATEAQKFVTDVGMANTRQQVRRDRNKRTHALG